MAGELLDNRGRGEAQWSWPSIHSEGRRFGLITGALSLIAAYMAWETLAWPLAFLTMGVLAFFRDPERVVPQGPQLILSPADGLVSLIAQVAPPAEMRAGGGDALGLGTEPVTRLSIFMSVFDVHVNRSPIAGTVRRVVYVPGRFVNADLDKASEENERQYVLIERADGGLIGLTQIAGLLARRIVPFVKPGDIVAAGQRIGLIRFGSRVDVYLPAGTDASVVLGQKVIAGETVLAETGRQHHLEGVNQ